MFSPRLTCSEEKSPDMNDASFWEDVFEGNIDCAGPEKADVEGHLPRTEKLVVSSELGQLDRSSSSVTTPGPVHYVGALRRWTPSLSRVEHYSPVEPLKPRTGRTGSAGYASGVIPVQRKNSKSRVRSKSQLTSLLAELETATGGEGEVPRLRRAVQRRRMRYQHQLHGLGNVVDLLQNEISRDEMSAMLWSDSSFDESSQLKRFFRRRGDEAALALLSRLLGRYSGLYLSRATNEYADSLSPSAYRQEHVICVEKWSSLLQRVLDWCSSGPGQVRKRTMGRYKWNYETKPGRFLCKARGSKSFVLFMADFIMAFDEDIDMLALACPLSGPIAVSPQDLSMDKLLDEIPEPQVHFIARRLVQLSRIAWQFDCLATSEKELTEAARLERVTDILAGSSIDLEATSLGLLVGCQVGLIDRVDQVYRVGLEIFETVFELIECGGISYPVKQNSATLLSRPGVTDFLNMSVGGVHNLSFIPRNEDFSRSKGVPCNDPGIVHDFFLQLGYGEQMCGALRERAANMLLRCPTVTMEGVLESLIQMWKNASDRSMIPLTFRRRIRSRRNKGDTFLVLNSGKLYIAKSGKNISKSLTFGLNSSVAQATLGLSYADKEITTQGEVSSMFDAVAHLHGHQPNFPKGGPGWYTPNPSGMSDISGALILLSVMLTGKVKPYGKFMDVVPKPKNPVEYENMIMQSVCFDIPISYGLAYTTFACGYEPRNTKFPVPVGNFCTVGEEWWDSGYNYSYPILVGGPRSDENVRSAVFFSEAQEVPDISCAPVQNRYSRSLVNNVRNKVRRILPSLNADIVSISDLESTGMSCN